MTPERHERICLIAPSTPASFFSEVGPISRVDIKPVTLVTKGLLGRLPILRIPCGPEQFKQGITHTGGSMRESR